LARRKSTDLKCVELSSSAHFTAALRAGRYASKYSGPGSSPALYVRFRANTCARRAGPYGRKSDTPDPRRRRIRAWASRIPPASLVCLHVLTAQNSAQAHFHSAWCRNDTRNPSIRYSLRSPALGFLLFDLTAIGRDMLAACPIRPRHSVRPRTNASLKPKRWYESQENHGLACCRSAHHALEPLSQPTAPSGSAMMSPC
jgi:hypothetical protein